MPFVTVEDGTGDTIRFEEVDGIFYPPLPSIDQDTAIRESKHMATRDDDVILVTYPKSGTHWIWEVLSMLVTGKAESIPYIKQNRFIEFTPAHLADTFPSPRVFNTHFRYDALPTQALEKKTKVVLVFRNPKDVMVSHYNHHIGLEKLYNYHGQWKNWTKLFYEGNVDNGNWFDFTLDWERAVKQHPDHPIHVLFYEDMKEDSRREVKKLASFLGMTDADELCNAVADKCQFHNMVKDKKGLEKGEFVSMWKNNKPNYFRKGEVGDWKNVFTVAQNEEFDAIFQKRMASSGLKFRFEI